VGYHQRTIQKEDKRTEFLLPLKEEGLTILMLPLQALESPRSTKGGRTVDSEILSFTGGNGADG
jgi:hypothetical protein